MSATQRISPFCNAQSLLLLPPLPPPPCVATSSRPRSEQKKTTQDSARKQDAPPRVVGNVAFQVEVRRGLHFYDDAVIWRFPLYRWRVVHFLRSQT